MQKGNAFPEQHYEEKPQVILNEKAARLLSWEDFEGQWFEPQHLDHRAEVLGFVKDFNFESLRNDIIPTAFLFDPENSHIMYLRLGDGAIAPTIDFVKGFYDERFNIVYFYLRNSNPFKLNLDHI